MAILNLTDDFGRVFLLSEDPRCTLLLGLNTPPNTALVRDYGHGTGGYPIVPLALAAMHLTEKQT